MKKIIMMAAMTVAVLSASAQSRFEPGTLTIQPKTGGVGAMLSNTPDVDIEGLSNTIDATAIGGAFVGVEMEYQLTDRLSCAGGLNWSQAGSGWKDTDIKVNNQTVKLRDFKIETSYVNVPLTLNYYVLKGFALKTGVQFSFLTSADMKASLSYSEGGLSQKTEFDEDCKDAFNKFDISIPVGLSYEFKVPIVLDLRYNIGLTKVNKDSEPGVKDSRNQICTFTVGYKFKL